MVPLLRGLLAQVADEVAAWGRLERALHPGGVRCPQCGESIAARFARVGPPRRYRCAICQEAFESWWPLPVAECAASWGELLEVLARAVCFGPQHRSAVSGLRPTYRRRDALRAQCDDLVRQRPALVRAIFGLARLPAPLAPQAMPAAEATLIALPQPAEAAPMSRK